MRSKKKSAKRIRRIKGTELGTQGGEKNGSCSFECERECDYCQEKGNASRNVHPYSPKKKVKKNGGAWGKENEAI